MMSHTHLDMGRTEHERQRVRVPSIRELCDSETGLTLSDLISSTTGTTAATPIKGTAPTRTSKIRHHQAQVSMHPRAQNQATPTRRHSPTPIQKHHQHLRHHPISMSTPSTSPSSPHSSPPPPRTPSPPAIDAVTPPPPPRKRTDSLTLLSTVALIDSSRRELARELSQASLYRIPKLIRHHRHRHPQSCSSSSIHSSAPAPDPDPGTGAGGLFLKYYDYFRTKQFPNLDEVGHGLWDAFWRDKHEYERGHWREMQARGIH